MTTVACSSLLCVWFSRPEDIRPGTSFPACLGSPMGCCTAAAGAAFEVPAILPPLFSGTGIGLLTGPGEFLGCCGCCLKDPRGSMDCWWWCCPARLMAEGSESLLVSWWKAEGGEAIMGGCCCADQQ